MKRSSTEWVNLTAVFMSNLAENWLSANLNSASLRNTYSPKILIEMHSNAVCCYVFLKMPWWQSDSSFPPHPLIRDEVDEEWARIYIYSKEGGLRPPSISPCGARVLAPDCRGPSAPSSQSLRNSYKVGHYCVYPVTLWKRSVVLSLQIMMSKKTTSD